MIQIWFKYIKTFPKYKVLSEYWIMFHLFAMKKNLTILGQNREIPTILPGRQYWEIAPWIISPKPRFRIFQYYFPILLEALMLSENNFTFQNFITDCLKKIQWQNWKLRKFWIWKNTEENKEKSDIFWTGVTFTLLS